MIPSCVVTTEAVQLDVGRGVAVVDHEARVDAAAPCALDFGASLLAREEGRGPPERIVWRIDVDGALVVTGGPLGPASVEIAKGKHRVRLRAAMRGERFVSAPLSLDPSTRGAPVSFTAHANSVWGAFAVAGEARWIDVGVPVVVQIDAARDHEPQRLSTLVEVGPVPVFVVDAGPMSPRVATSSSRAELEADLAAGGVRALAALLDDLPLAVATAPDDATALARLADAAHAALSASRSSDPLTAAVGQRVATALATGFEGCRRDDDVHLPLGWPAAAPSMIAGGLFEDADAGCPRVADLLAADHPQIPIRREAAAALEEALADARVEPLVPVRSVERGRAPLGGRASRRVPRRRIAAYVALVALAVVLLASLAARRAWARDETA